VRITVRVWDARSGNHPRIEVHAKAHGIVTTEELIVVATSLGLAAFRFTTTTDAAVLHQQPKRGRKVKRSTITRSSEVAPSTAL
jgi:hypothetical protein